MKLLEKKYNKLAELLPEVIIEADLKLNLTYVNSIAFKKFGYSRKDFDKGLNIFQFIFPEEILRDYNPPELSQDIHSELQEYTKKVEERTIDDYLKAEGMTSGSVSLPGTDISIKEM